MELPASLRRMFCLIMSLLYFYFIDSESGRKNATILPCTSKLSKRVWVGRLAAPMASGPKFRQGSTRAAEGAPKVFRLRNSQRFIIMEINSAELQKAAAATSDNAPELMGADILIKALQAENVQYIWGYPGGAALYIYDAIYRQDTIEHILVRHEQAAVHAADGYARATGQVGVALVTSGPA
jgi:hypothetical protein